MDLDTESDNTSLYDKTEDFCDNPTRDALTEGIMSLLKPTIDKLDERVRASRISQVVLKQQIDSLNEDLLKLSEALQQPVELDAYVKKLVNAKQKVMIVSNVLQMTQSRLILMNQYIEKKSAKQRALLVHSLSHGVDSVSQKSTKDEESEKSSVNFQQ